MRGIPYRSSASAQCSALARRGTAISEAHAPLARRAHTSLSAALSKKATVGAPEGSIARGASVWEPRPLRTISEVQTPADRDAYRTAPFVVSQYVICGEPLELICIEGVKPVRPFPSTSLVHQGEDRPGPMERVPNVSDTAGIESRTTLSRTDPLFHAGTVIGTM